LPDRRTVAISSPVGRHHLNWPFLTGRPVLAMRVQQLGRYEEGDNPMP